MEGSKPLRRETISAPIKGMPLIMAILAMRMLMKP
jgi:hypothetical protein